MRSTIQAVLSVSTERTLKLAALSLRVPHVRTLWYISTVRLTKSDSRGNARDQSTSSTAARNLGAFIAALDAPRLQERTGASHQLEPVNFLPRPKSGT